MLMTQEFESLLTTLIGQEAWRPSRSIGSMFFLDVGEPVKIQVKGGDGKRLPRDVGTWRFLIQMCHWKFTRAHNLIVGSDDEAETIDQIFEALELGPILVTTHTLVAQSLGITFSSGAKFETFPYVSGATDDNQWTFYSPDCAWTFSASGQLTRHQRS
jgi:hypothetical protein